MDWTEVRLAKAFCPMVEIRLLFKNLTIITERTIDII